MEKQDSSSHIIISFPNIDGELLGLEVDKVWMEVSVEFVFGEGALECGKG